MSGREEHADGVRSGPFPESWGNPRGATSSDERRDWVMNQVRRHVIVRKLSSDPGLREAYVAAKRVGP